MLPIFDVIAKTGNIPERDMFNTFNMGVGMTVVVDKADADKAIEAIKQQAKKLTFWASLLTLTWALSSAKGKEI